MGPEVLVFAVGFYVGWLLLVLSALLTIPRRTRYFAFAVLAVSVVGGVIGTLFVEWGVPWNVSFPLVFATIAVPATLIACVVAAVIGRRSWKVRSDAA